MTTDYCKDFRKLERISAFSWYYYTLKEALESSLKGVLGRTKKRERWEGDKRVIETLEKLVRRIREEGRVPARKTTTTMICCEFESP